MPSLKKSIHGENLEEREPYTGRKPRRYFKRRDVFCPTCGAKPNRRCTWTAEHLTGRYIPIINKYSGGLDPDEAQREAARRNRKGGRDHAAGNEPTTSQNSRSAAGMLSTSSP